MLSRKDTESQIKFDITNTESCHRLTIVNTASCNKIWYNVDRRPASGRDPAPENTTKKNTEQYGIKTKFLRKVNLC